LRTFNQFDRVARVYDKLAKLVFGKSIVVSQQVFLNDIPPRAKILMLGGGTGWILNEIAKTTTSCEIWYIDASAKMIDLARENANALQVHFIHGTEEDIPPAMLFDVVITNFYLDLFDEQKLEIVVRKIILSLTRDALWMVTDFLHRKRWHGVFLTVMYSFFRVVAHLKNRGLPDWNSALQRVGYRKINSGLFYWGFIESAIFRRS